MSETDAFEIQITYPAAELAREAAAALVEARLIACGQVTEITSVYPWEGEVFDEPEWLLTAKTTRACLAAIEARVLSDHPYDVPQVTALPIAWGSADYIAWIHETCQPTE